MNTRIPARSTWQLALWFVAVCCASMGQLAIAQGASRFDTTDEDRLAGYRYDGQTVVFLFDASIYNLDQPTRVIVTGPFRTWSTQMDDSEWMLSPVEGQSGLWELKIPNHEYSRIPPATPFKFRINDGVWLEPPVDAPNLEGGNLVFEPGVQPKRLRAEIESDRAIRVTFSGREIVRPLDKNAYRLTDAMGNEVEIAEVIPNTASESLVVPRTRIDKRRVYYLEVPNQKLKSLCRRDGWLRKLYSSKQLGANVNQAGTETTFRLFAPRAEGVKLYLYRSADDSVDQAIKVIDLQRDDDGVWEASEAVDLHGIYYDFTIHGPTEPGNWFYEAYPQHVTDPYARVSDDSFGKCRVWRATTPATPLKDGRPSMEDVIAYEVHVQDFTDQLPVDAAMRGTFSAMKVRGLRNSHEQPIGFDHLVDLGINVVHLMPVQEFLHYPDAEWQATFGDNAFAKAQQIDQENYQWGYRTTHAFAIESRYRKRGSELGAEREQFRDLVQAFHDDGIAVIIDLVPNHTGENMDGRHYLFNFNAIDLPYYYRTDQQLDHIGPFGNEVKTEDRPMVQRWLIDQCRQLIDEFGIDGFRIDLAGQIDKQSLERLRHELGDDIIIYGEPWIPPTDPEVARNPDWGWYKEDAPITFFQDDVRNTLRGPVSDPQDKLSARGYAGGDGSLRDKVQLSLLNSFEDERDPNRGISYLDIHDNWALADRFATQDWDGRRGVDERPFKIAAGLLFTSLGPIVLHGGTEFMRSKGSAPLVEQVIESASGPLAFHGKRDSYNLRAANQFVWENIGRSLEDPDAPCDYRGMQAWWRGMIAMRRSEAGAAFRVGQAPPENYYQWILPDNPQLLGYVVDQQFLVLVNTSDQVATFEGFELPAGNWRLVADIDSVDHADGIDGVDPWLEGQMPLRLVVPATALKIWMRK